MESVIAIGVVAILLTTFLAVFGPATQGIRRASSTQEADRLAATLRVPVETYDERLTTISAERMMTDAGLDSRSQRKVVDKIFKGAKLHT